LPVTVRETWRVVRPMRPIAVYRLRFMAANMEKLFTLTANPKLFASFFWLYNTGLAITVAMMAVHGTLTVLGHESTEAIAGIAGLGHILLTVGLVLFFVNLGKRISAHRS
jgi:hypothetical protein